jgi:UDP-glucose 4-epimerase
LITGGNGYVGREVTRLLYDRYEICVVDCLRGGHVRFRPDELEKIRFERTDLTDSAATSKVVSDFAPDTVIHLAAMHYIPECEQFPVEAVNTNVLGTINVLLAAPPQARFVFASSGAVYEPESEPHREATSPLVPSDVYGFSKLNGEQYVRYFAAQRKLSAVNVRLFNVVGPGETNPHLLPEIIAQLKAGRKTIQLGNMWPKRDYIHVKDAASGFVAAALTDRVQAGDILTVNLGTSQPFSVEEVIQKLKRIAGIEFSVEEDRSRARKVDRPYLAADNSEIRRVLGWKPALTIDDALADLWREPDMTPELAEKYR